MQPRTFLLLSAALGSTLAAEMGLLFETSIAGVINHMPDCGWTCWRDGVAATSCQETNVTCVCDQWVPMANAMEDCIDKTCGKRDWCKSPSSFP